MTAKPLLGAKGPFVLKSNRNLLVLAEVLAKANGVSVEDAVTGIEASYVRAAEAEFGTEYEFWARIKPDGTISLAQVLKVVDVVRSEYREVALGDLSRYDANAALGQFVVNELDSVHPEKIVHWLQSEGTEICNISLSVEQR